MSPRKTRNLIGLTFGRLTPLERSGANHDNKTLWLCRCDCGSEIVVLANSLLTGNTKSCGCLNNERITETRRTHGLSESPIYETWCGIKKRCTNPNAKAYKNYGERGITMFPEWLRSFDKFLSYVSALPGFGLPNMTIDRINNDGNYEPGNIRWADKLSQANNTRSNVLLTHNGITLSIAQWANELGIPRSCLYARWRNGWNADKIIETPSRKA